MRQSRRRYFLIASGAILAIPRAVLAQAQKTHRIGWLGQPRPNGPYNRFLQRAKELGYVEGKNLTIDYRTCQSVDEGKPFADAMVRAKVELIVAQAPIALQVARAATQTIPIVAFYIGDPIRMGVVKSLAHPGGNITGFTWDPGAEWVGKSLQLIKEVLPRASRIALLWNIENVSHPMYVKECESYARTLGLSTLSLGVSRAEEFEGVFKKMAQERASAVFITTDPLTVRNLKTLSALLNRFPVPAMWGSAFWPLAGALITFGPDTTDQPKRVAEYMDKIFNGSSPASLPIQQPTKFDLVIDLKVSKALGIVVPQSVLNRADKVIE